MSIKNIPKGSYNWLLSQLGLNAEEIEKMATERMLICNQCNDKNIALNVCKLCGCFLPTKTRVKEEECPKNKWNE